MFCTIYIKKRLYFPWRDTCNILNMFAKKSLKFQIIQMSWLKSEDKNGVGNLLGSAWITSEMDLEIQMSREGLEKKIIKQFNH